MSVKPADEIDRALSWILTDPKEEIQNAITQSTVVYVAEIMRAIVVNEESLRTFFRLDREIDEIDFSFDNKKYGNEIKDIIIQKVISVISNKLIHKDKKLTQIFLEDQPHLDFSQAVDFVRTVEETLRNRILIAKYLINMIIPSSLTSRLGFDYALSKETKLAIPYKCTIEGYSCPKLQCSFGNPYELMLLTMWGYLRQKS